MIRSKVRHPKARKSKLKEFRPNARWLAIFLTIPTLFLGCKSSDESTEDKAGVAMMELARQLVQSKQSRKAIDMLLPWSRREPDNKEVRNLLGLAFLDTKNYEPALVQFEVAAKLTKDSTENIEAKINQSYVLILLKKYEKSIAILNEILKKNTYLEMEKVYNNLGLAYFERNQCDKAVPYLSKAVSLNPMYVPSLYNLGRCAAKKRDYVGAEGYYRAAKTGCFDCLEATVEYFRAGSLAGKKKQVLVELEGYRKKIASIEGHKVLDDLKKEIDNERK